MPGKSLRFHWFSISAVLALCACTPHHKTSQDINAALLAAHYAAAPIITSIVQEDSGTIAISGEALPDGRVGFNFDGHSSGFTADSDGKFRAEVPIGQGSGLYNLFAEDDGRLIQAEGRLFVPYGHPEKSVLLRTGSPSRPLFDGASAIATVDYDSIGAFAVSGKVAPSTPVNITLDGQAAARVNSDAKGFYGTVMQISESGAQPTAAFAIVAQTKAGMAHRVVTLTPATTPGDHIAAIYGGWRVDWVLPGGGQQTTLVF